MATATTIQAKKNIAIATPTVDITSLGNPKTVLDMIGTDTDILRNGTDKFAMCSISIIF